uniref:Uncharacterized protein n=1 Tax=Panagrolaimus davidi TaxID=227884 RepID=A0A914PU61_9BILA
MAANSEKKEKPKLRDSYSRLISTKYQEIYDTLKPIIDAQHELRVKCWFTWLIGVPVKDSTVVPKRDNDDEKSIVESEVELDSDISTDNYSGESDSSDSDSSADTDASDITDNKLNNSVSFFKRT